MPVITYREAVRHALAVELERDKNVVVMGEEVAQFNGAYKVTEGLLAKFGHDRVVDTPISEAGFIDDLRTARGVIASGGFTLMGEAVYLRRPMLAVPVGGQFEQVLNARYLEAEGYGLGADELTSERLSEFLERLPDFERRLAGYNQQGNVELLAKLDDLLQQAAASRAS